MEDKPNAIIQVIKYSIRLNTTASWLKLLGLKKSTNSVIRPITPFQVCLSLWGGIDIPLRQHNWSL